MPPTEPTNSPIPAALNNKPKQEPKPAAKATPRKTRTPKQNKKSTTTTKRKTDFNPFLSNDLISFMLAVIAAGLAVTSHFLPEKGTSTIDNVAMGLIGIAARGLGTADNNNNTETTTSSSSGTHI